MLTDLGQYAFQGEIGRGAMAIVWRAWDTKLERVVAVGRQRVERAALEVPQ